MKNLYKFYLLAFVLFSDFIVYAQEDDPGGGGGPDEGGGDPQPAPINTKLILLAVMGILFVIYTYRKNKKTA